MAALAVEAPALQDVLPAFLDLINLLIPTKEKRSSTEGILSGHENSSGARKDLFSQEWKNQTPL